MGEVILNPNKPGNKAKTYPTTKGFLTEDELTELLPFSKFFLRKLMHNHGKTAQQVLDTYSKQ